MTTSELLQMRSRFRDRNEGVRRWFKLRIHDLNRMMPGRKEVCPPCLAKNWRDNCGVSSMQRGSAWDGGFMAKILASAAPTWDKI
jgi:hypothetical protein